MIVERGSFAALVLGLAAAAACGAAPGAPPAVSAPPSATGGTFLSVSSPESGASLVPARAPREGSSSLVLATQGDATLAFAANGIEDAVITVDVGTRRATGALSLPGGPEQLLALADGRLAVTLRASGEVAVLEPDAAGALIEARRVRVGSDPFALAASPDASTLYVSCGFEGAVVALDAETLETRFRVRVASEPRALWVAADGKRIYASHANASVATSIDVEYAGTPRVQAADLAVDDTLFLIGPGEVTTRFFVDQGFAMTERAGRLYIPGAFKEPGPRKVTGGYGGTSAPIHPTVRSIDLATFEPMSRGLGVSRFADLGNECTLPRAILAGAEERLFVACLGIDQVLELDGRAVDPITSLVRRYDVPEGPTGLALAPGGRELVTYSPLAGSMGFVDLAKAETVELPLPTRVEATLTELERRGRHLFTTTRDARIAMDNRSCESCHPDGRDDGQTWSTPDGLRQTISLAGRVGAGGRFGWFGDNRSIELHVRHTAKRLRGAGFEGGADDARDLRAIAAWIRAMPAPSPIVAPDDPIARVGAHAFTARGCDRCHRDGGTDERAHDVGTGTFDEASLAFDTPSLRLTNHRGPLFHDGRYASFDAMLRAPKGPMAAPGADATEREALERYVASLPAASPRRVPQGPFTEGAEARPFRPLYPDDFRARVLTRAQRGPRDSRALDLGSVPTTRGLRASAALDLSWDGLFRLTPEGFDALGEPLAPERDGAAIEGRGILRFQPPLYGSDVVDDQLDWRDLTGDPRVRYTSFEWSRLDGSPDGGVRHRAATGVLDTRTGATRLVTRVDGPTLEVCDGHGRVLRTTCPTCEKGSRDRLLLVTRDSHGLRTDSLSLEPGEVGRIVSTGYEVIPPKDVELQYQPRRLIGIDATHAVRHEEADVSIYCAPMDIDEGIFLF